MLKRWMTLVLLAAALALGASACGGDDDGDDGGVTPGPGTPSDERVVVDAPIDELEILIRESFPVQYAVRIVSGLPNGCAQFHEAAITSRSGTTIAIRVTNTMPADTTIACTAIYGQHESVVELGTGDGFTAGTEYTVRVNDKDVRFTAQ